MENVAQDNVAQTWVTAPKRVPKTLRDACLVHIYPTGATMGERYQLAGQTLVLGRGDDCDVQIQEHSVSRRHARIELGPEGYFVCDLQSTNGTFVNDSPVNQSRLRDGDYLRVGNCIYRFLSGGNIEAEYHEEIYRLTIIDGLTGIHNQRYMLEFLDRELARSARHQRPLSVGMIDIDHFKAVNDQHGHLAGDAALRELTACIQQAIRREDLFARYGGEEFGLILVETELAGARIVAERLRKTVEAHEFRYDDKPMPLTVSIGLAYTCGDESMTSAQLIKEADELLYQAKAQGRNRVCG